MAIDWARLFVPSGSILEIMLRGTIVYLVLFAAMRLLPRRALGSLGGSDLLVLVVIADAVQNAMGGEYRSITEGLALACTIFAWAALIDWLDYRFPHWHLAAAAHTALVVDGELQRDNLRREMITEEELMAQMRQHGQESLRNVRRAFVEGSGQVSVILKG